MLRLPTFGTVRYYEVSEDLKDGENPIWLTEYPREIVYKEDLEKWKEDVLGNVDIFPNFIFKECSLSNRDFERKYIFGNYDENFSGEILDKDCPECGHLLVNQTWGCRCTDCDYQDEECRRHEEDQERKMKAPPLPKFKEVNQTLEEFKEKYGFVIRDDQKKCYSCKEELLVNDYYRTSDYAVIEYICPQCDNKPATFILLGKCLVEWRNIL